MSDVLKWCCKNGECKRLNAVDESLIKELEAKKLKVNLICGTCGYVHGIDEINKSKIGSDWNVDIPCNNAERMLPIGRMSNGDYIDYMGKPITRHESIEKYGIDPEIYLKWRDAGKPKYKSLCR